MTLTLHFKRTHLDWIGRHGIAFAKGLGIGASYPCNVCGVGECIGAASFDTVLEAFVRGVAQRFTIVPNACRTLGRSLTHYVFAVLSGVRVTDLLCIQCGWLAVGAAALYGGSEAR